MGLWGGAWRWSPQWTRLLHFKRDSKEILNPFCPVRTKQEIHDLLESLHPIVLVLWLPASKTVSTKFLSFYKLLNKWYFAGVACMWWWGGGNRGGKETLENPLDCKEINPSQSQRGSTLHIHWKDSCWSWPPDTKNWLIGKDPDAGKDWRQKKGMVEDEMIR